MIISHKYKFIFIKTRKTAGTSIEVFLSQHCDDDDITTPIYPHVEPHVARNYQGLWNPLPEMFYRKGWNVNKTISDVLKRRKFFNHMPAKVIRARVSNEIWRDYYKFCVERNSWDKTLSHYYSVNVRTKKDLSLDDYFQQRSFCVDHSKYLDEQGNLMVDRVIRYESLNQELGEVFNQLGIPFDGSLGIYAKGKYRTDKSPYQEIFSTSQKEIIEKAFAKEIALYGYSYCNSQS